MTNSAFICAVCWGVFAETCSTCPDRGNGRGVTVQQIKDAIMSCGKVADVNATAVHYHSHVKALERHSPEARTMAIQIKNLASYRRQSIGETWRE
jgi:hypothetical protein